MRSCSTDSEMLAHREAGNIGSIVKASGGDDGQALFLPSWNGGVRL